jgi:ATP-dependent helicase/nuclease subunit A
MRDDNIEQTDESTDTGLPIEDDGELTMLADDQNEVVEAYRDGDRFVVAPASSGTGKTTLATRAATDGVYRDLATNGKPGGLLFTTFTKRAARQARERMIAELETYVAERRTAGTDQGDPLCENWNSVRTWLHETADVRTLDSVFIEWYEEIARMTDLPMDISVGDAGGHSELLDRAYQTLSSERTTDPHLDAALTVLERRYGTTQTQTGHVPWVPKVSQLHQKCREFGKPPGWGAQKLRENVQACFPVGHPENANDVADAVAALSNDSVAPEHISDEWVAYTQATYDATERLASSLATVLKAFAGAYDGAVRESGILTHHDVTYYVMAALDEELPGAETLGDAAGFVALLRERYDHVIIDEMQDTSYSQIRLLSWLFPKDMDDVEGLGIGDLKQSVYGWRSADPALFAEIIGVEEAPSGALLGVNDVLCHELTASYRSHPHIIGAVNGLFPAVFSDPNRGAEGRFPVPYQPLYDRRVPTDEDDPHIHVIELPSEPRRDIESAEAPSRVASRLRGAVDEGLLSIDRNQALVGDPDTTPDLQPMTDGDIALIFRAGTYMEAYAQTLSEYGFKTAVLSGDNLFETPEVRMLRGLLEAVADFAQPTSVRWLAESAFTTMDSATIDVLDGSGFDLDTALEAIEHDLAAATDPAVAEKLEAVRSQITALTALRDDLRVARHGPKEALLRRLVDSSALEPLLLGTAGGFGKNANVERFINIVTKWESDEPLSLQALLKRVGRMADDSGEEHASVDGPEVAVTADEYADDTVLILTAHKAKGLEFKTVVLPDLHRKIQGWNFNDQEFVTDRELGLAVRPWADGAARPSQAPSNNSFDNFWHTDSPDQWEDCGQTWLTAERDPSWGSNPGVRQHEHPLAGVIGDSVAEEWRVLYVAITRACDHLILPLHEPFTWAEPAHTWGATLWEALDLNTDGGPVQRAPGLDVDGNPVGIPVGYNTLPQGDPVDVPELGYANRRLAGTYRQRAGDGIETSSLPPAAPEAEARTAPEKVTPSDFYELLDDSEAILQSMSPEVSVLTGPAPVVPASYPGGLKAGTWGDVAHSAAELAIEATVDPAVLKAGCAEAREVAREAVEQELGDVYDDSILGEVTERIVDDILPALGATETYREAIGAAHHLPELPTAGTYKNATGRVWLEGEYDLLYEDDRWVLAEFKTGTPPTTSPWTAHEKFVDYCLQLALYRWLLEAERGVLEIDRFRLVYLWPEPIEFEIQLERGGIETALDEIVEGRPVGDD